MNRCTVRGRALGVISLSVISVLAAAAKPAPAVGSPAAPPNAHVYGKDLTQWLAGYWTWYYSTGQNLGIYPTPGPFRPGPAPVVFMPMPGAGESTQTGGNWTPDDPAIMVGTIHATLRTGTGFVIPAFAWIGERYTGYPAVPDDPMVHNSAIRNAVFDPSGVPGDPPILTLDGKPLLRDFWANYVGPQAFESPVMYPQPSSYGSVAAVAWQSVGMVVKPLSPGRHVMHLYEKYILTDADIDIPGYQMGVIYDNTWIIDVVPGR